MTVQPVETVEEIIEEDKDNDDLTHRVCPNCEIADQGKGIPPGALCGKRKYGWITAINSGPARQCIVCEELKPAGCPKCGFQWPRTNL